MMSILDHPKDDVTQYTYDYPRPCVTVDLVIFGYQEDPRHPRLKLLVIKRADEPFRGQYALPGGFVDMDEDLETAARRELEEETGLKDVFLEQLYTFGAPKRDPRTRVITVAYYALVNLKDHPIKAGSDAADAMWLLLPDDLPLSKMDKSGRLLAFDHDEIVKTAIQRLRGKIVYQPIGFELLPKKFSLPQLQRLYELVLDRKLDPRNFKKKFLRLGILEELKESLPISPMGGRPALLYRFDERKYRKKVKEGFIFEVEGGVA